MGHTGAFFREEVRSGFLVTEKRKKVWAIELEILDLFDKVCRKYGLKWYAYYGTLLGAVRHQGFIPWDDDIDVVMFRDDYEKLKLVAPQRSQNHIFFKTGIQMRECGAFRRSGTAGQLQLNFQMHRIVFTRGSS